MLKVVYASTPEQEQTISEFVCHLYSEILPKYFDDHEIQSFIELGILQLPQGEWIHTLREGFKIITSLQVLIDIIEKPEIIAVREEYEEMFKKNKQILESYGFSFPFNYHQFLDRKRSEIPLSMYTKSSNAYLI